MIWDSVKAARKALKEGKFVVAEGFSSKESIHLKAIRISFKYGWVFVQKKNDLVWMEFRFDEIERGFPTFRIIEK